MKKIVPYRVENVERKEIACFHRYITVVCQNVALCGKRLIDGREINSETSYKSYYI